MNEDGFRYGRLCPVCRGYAGAFDDGTLLPHQRYADGAGVEPGLSHDMIECEGTLWTPSMKAS